MSKIRLKSVNQLPVVAVVVILSPLKIVQKQWSSVLIKVPGEWIKAKVNQKSTMKSQTQMSKIFLNTKLAKYFEITKRIAPRISLLN